MFSEFYTSFLKKEQGFEKENLVLQISTDIKTTKEDFLLFLSITEQKRKDGTSFVLVCNTINIDDYPENFNIVPTLLEAKDIIEMEAMERELGF